MGRLPVFRTLRDATRLLRAAWWPLLLWGVAGNVVIGLALAPLFLWLLAELLTLTGADVVLNYDLASLALSIEGVFLGLLWSFLACALLVMALGGFVVLSTAAHVRQRITVPRTLRRVAAGLHRIPGRGGLKLTLWGFVLIPLIGAVGSAVTAAVLAPFGAGPVERMLPDEVYEIAWVTPAFVALSCLGYAIYVRWVFTVHCFVLERISLTRAVRHSVELVRGNFWPVARVFATQHLVAVLAFGVVSLLLGLLDEWTLSLSSAEVGPAFGYLVALMVVVDAAVLGLTAVFFTSWGVALGTVLYFRLQSADVAIELETTDVTARPATRRRRLAVAGGLVLLLGGATGLTVPKVREELSVLDRACTVTAHRGASAGAPENTLAAVELAIEEGADVVEIDVQETVDGHVVVVHDERLDRVAGVARRPTEMTLAELKALDVGSWFGLKFAGERIPTLAEVIERARGRVDLNIELKLYGEDRNLAGAVVKIIRDEDFADDCVIQSLDYPVLERVRGLDPSLRVGMIVSAKVGRVHRLDVDFFSVQPKYATVSFIRRAHMAGRRVYVWTINDPVKMNRYIDRGVDSIITDHPGTLAAILDERTELDELYAAVRRLFRR